MRTYDTPIGILPSVTTICHSISNPHLTKKAADITFVTLTDAIWEAYSGLSRFDEKEELVRYLKSFPTYQDVWDEEARKGSFVHNALEAYFKGDFSGTQEDLLYFLSEYYPKEDVQLVSAAFAALNDNGIKILDSEMTVYHPDGFAGTLDAIIEWEGAIGILDFKTSKDIFWNYWLQTEAYRRAYTWMYKKEPVFRMIIRLCKEPKKLGRYEIHIRPLQINNQIRIWYDGRKKKYVRDHKVFPCDHEEDYKAFMAAKTIFERGQKK